ncbi:MAG: hypothetical protein GXO40_03320 [Epsilonproteobacteria bacterium]|nr:hypothetical protein [Campylobacterota bacterium]
MTTKLQKLELNTSKIQSLVKTLRLASATSITQEELYGCDIENICDVIEDITLQNWDLIDELNLKGEQKEIRNI